jgi:hypothetical protein
MGLSPKPYEISPELFDFFVSSGNIFKFDIKNHFKSFKEKHTVQL